MKRIKRLLSCLILVAILLTVPVSVATANASSGSSGVDFTSGILKYNLYICNKH